MNRIHITVFSLLLVASITITGCKTTPKERKLPVDETTEFCDPSSSEFISEFLKEGFIAEDSYRVVIISSKEEYQSGTESIKKRAEQRALISIQKLLIDNNYRLTSRSRRALKQLILENSTFSAVPEKCRQEYVFHLYIKKADLKKRLLDIARMNQ